MSAEPARKPLPEARPPRPAVVPDTVCGRCWGIFVRFPVTGRRGCASWVCELRAFQSAMKGEEMHREPTPPPPTPPHPRQGQHCAACGKAFVFYPHERTRRLAPLILADDGNVALNDDGTYRIIKKGEVVEGRRYLNHFVDCPDAPRFARTPRSH